MSAACYITDDMSTIAVVIELPFYIRLQDTFVVPYEKICPAARISELVRRNVEISFSPREVDAIDKSVWPGLIRTTVCIQIETGSPLTQDDADTFAIRDCLEILNKVTAAYQAATGEVSNAGFSSPSAPLTCSSSPISKLMVKVFVIDGLLTI